MATNGKGSFEMSRSALVIGLFSLLAVGSWVGFDLYRALVKSTIPEVLQSQILPLEVGVSDELLQDLRSRRRVDDLTLSQVVSIPAVEPGATPSPVAIQVATEVATESAVTSTTDDATTSGEIQL